MTQILKPRLVSNATGELKTLEIDGKPTILLGGQVHNSTTSSPITMAKAFAKAKALNYNFVIGSINWNQFEPSEGEFDFGLLEEQIKQAKANDLKLVLLWFGAFKNAASTYAPT
ncbi:MAG: Beta-galactosidase, partial [Actinomycetota bacterium]